MRRRAAFFIKPGFWASWWRAEQIPRSRIVTASPATGIGSAHRRQRRDREAGRLRSCAAALAVRVTAWTARVSRDDARRWRDHLKDSSADQDRLAELFLGRVCGPSKQINLQTNRPPNKLTNVALAPHFFASDKGVKIGRARPADWTRVMQIGAVQFAALMV